MCDSPIGLIGVGLLGSALAERMMGGGLPVAGYDLNPAALERLRVLGGSAAAAPHELAVRCRKIVLCLPDSHIVADVVHRLEDKLPREALLIDATTGDPEDTAALGKHLAERGIGYVDATIAGSSQQVLRGEAGIMLGGTVEDVARAEPVVATWSDCRTHIGPVGSGARMKLIVNLVLGLNRAVLAEGLTLARACQIDPSLALKVLKTTPARSAVMDTKGAKMIAREYSPAARLAQHHKDVGLIRALAQRHGARTPLSDLHEDLLRQAIELGYGDADNSAIIEVFEKTPLRT